MIYVPHGRRVSMRIMKGNSISAWIPFHLQLFARKFLFLLLKEAGFKNIRIYEYYPGSWLPLSLMQWKNRDHPIKKFDYPLWISWLCYPIGWLANKARLGEELVGVGTR